MSMIMGMVGVEDDRNKADLAPANSPRVPVSNITPVVEGECVVLKNGQNGVNIRVGPGTSFNILGQAYDEDIYTYTGNVSEDGWYEINLPDGTLGYITGQFTDQLSCDDSIEKVESRNPNLHYLSKTELGGDHGTLTVFGLENYGFSLPPEILYAIYSVIRDSAQEYFGTTVNIPTAMVFTTQDEILKLAPNGRAALRRQEEMTGQDTYLRGVNEKFSFAGHFLAPYSTIAGDVYNGVFISIDMVQDMSDLVQIIAHEDTHAVGGNITGHEEVWNSQMRRYEYDYSTDNLAVYFERMAGVGYISALDTDGLNECNYTLDPDLCLRFKDAFMEVLYPQQGDVEEVFAVDIEASGANVSVSIPVEPYTLTTVDSEGNVIILWDGFKQGDRYFDKDMKLVVEN